MGLKGIPANINPDLLYVLSSMGHGDEIVFADIHFPTSSICKHGPKEIRTDGLRIPDLLKSVLKLFPLDTYDIDTLGQPAAIMDMVPGDKGRNEPDVWKIYQNIVDDCEKRKVPLQKVERFAFYERAKKAFAVVHTGETSTYANLILRKGLVDFNQE